MPTDERAAYLLKLKPRARLKALRALSLREQQSLRAGRGGNPAQRRRHGRQRGADGNFRIDRGTGGGGNSGVIRTQHGGRALVCHYSKKGSPCSGPPEF